MPNTDTYEFKFRILSTEKWEVLPVQFIRHNLTPEEAQEFALDIKRILGCEEVRFNIQGLFQGHYV